MSYGKVRTKAGKQATALGVLMAVALSFCGCSLAREELENLGQDRLVGIFLTTEYLDTGEPEIGMNWNGELYIENREEKIEGTVGNLSDESVLQFQGIEGYEIYDIMMQDERDGSYCSVFDCANIFTDLYLTSSDTEQKIEAVVYVGENGPRMVCFNPIYQREDGSVYLRRGTGLSWNGFADGAATSKRITQSVSEKVNGDENIKTFECMIKIQQSMEPVSTELLFLNEENEVLGSMEEKQIRESLEKEERVLEVPGGTEYLLLVQSGNDPDQGVTEKRSLCNKGEEYLELLLPGREGFLEAWQLKIRWQ